VRNNATDNPGFQNATFGLPAAGPVRFGTNGTVKDGETTTGFGFMGHMVLNTASDGSLNSLFFAEPTETDNIWALVWNQGEDKDVVPVTLKDQPPPNLRQ